MPQRGCSTITALFAAIFAASLLLGVEPALSQQSIPAAPPLPAMPNLSTLPNMPPVLQPSMPVPSMPVPSMPALPIPTLGPLNDENLTTTYTAIVDLYKAGKYDEAVPLAKDFLTSIEGRYGNDSTSYAGAISVLARLYQAQGHFKDAETYVKHALAIDERELEPNHPNIAGDLSALGQIYQDLGQMDEAEPLFRRALAINEANAAEPADVGRTLNNLAWLYQEQGRYTEAEPLITRSLSIIEKALGSKDADYGRSLDTLAKIYEGQGRINEAEPLYQRALVILEAALGSEHDSVAVSRENLGGLLKALGRLDEAEPLLKKALDAKERVFGPDHPNVANSLSQLGDLYRQEGKADEAEAEFQRALAIRKATISEVPVYFATDRMPEKGAKSITFGGEQTEALTVGQATIMVTKPEALRAHTMYNSPLSNRPTSSEAPHIETTEVARLAIRSIKIRQDLKVAQQRLDGATVFPKQAFVFVHGFNVSFENALRRTAQIAFDLNFDGAPFLFSWPSRGGFLNYFTDRDNAVTAANHLKAFLEKIVAETGATKIHLIAHSMGNVVLLDALEKMKLSNANQSGLRFAEIILHSPDVAKSRFGQLMTGIKGIGTSATLYASQSDRALNISAWIWGERAGATPSVVDGVETIDTTAAGSSFLGLNHDLYVTNPAIFNDMRLVLELGRHPPDQRSPAFERKATPDGTYWVYRRPTDSKEPASNPKLEAVALRKPDASGQDSVEPTATTEYDLKYTADEAVKLQVQLSAALAEAEVAKRTAEELRQQLELERGAKQAAEHAAAEARQQVELERSARLKAEREALAKVDEPAREPRSLDLTRPEPEKKSDTGSITPSLTEKSEKSSADIENAAPLQTQAPLTAQDPSSTEAAPAPLVRPDETKKKPDSKQHSKTGAERKRRPASSTAQQNWPFNEWN
jgi:esterase/lipase superfamily enzyme/Tfp pilus assembly protein PilF